MRVFLFIYTFFAFLNDAFSSTSDESASLLKKPIGEFWNYELANVQNSSITISNVIIALVFLVIGLNIAKRLSIIFKRKMLELFKLNRNSASGLEKFVQYTLITLVSLTALDIANVPLSGLTFVGGALAIGIGFGSQNILNNFISGLIIMIESPIRVGDIVEIEGNIAKVSNIGARCVHLETFDNIDLMVPNSNIIQNKIINWTLNDSIMRVKLPFYISIDSDPKQALLITDHILDKNTLIDKTFDSRSFVDRIEPVGIKIDVYFYIRVGEEIDKKAIINALSLEILDKFRKSNIELAKAPTLISWKNSNSSEGY